MQSCDKNEWTQELGQLNTLEELENYLSAQYTSEKMNRKKIPYADVLDQYPVRGRDTEKTAVFPITCYLAEYMRAKQAEPNPLCEKIRGFFNESDLRALVREIYTRWLQDGANTKQKNILLPYAAGLEDSEIPAFKAQIDLWTESSRGALAAFAVTALSLNSSDMALLLIDGISQKYKNKQVRKAALDVMGNMAKTLGITREELKDRIVPNLGFSKNRECIFDYGSRQFRGVLTGNLEVILFDASGKQLKNLPKANSKDDSVMAENAAALYKSLKKQLKTVVGNQKSRLEEAIITGRSWTAANWKKLFVDNPVMNGFAIGLIWEEQDQNGGLLGTFRYMEDGTMNTADEEEYMISEDSRILLLHPMDVSEELLAAWRQQLEDYEIVQPVLQLSMPVYALTEEEKEAQNIQRFSGVTVYAGAVYTVMERYGWQRTSVCDGGGYDGYYYEDASSHIGVQISFEFFYVGMMRDETVTIQDITFYQSGTIQYGSYVYDEINGENRVLPKDVPEKLLNFVLLAGHALAQKAISSDAHSQSN